MTLKDKHQGKLFSIGMKMAEVPEADYRLLGVMRRLGIKFGFGEKTVAEVCSEVGINPNTLLLICKIYTYENYVPSVEEIERSNIGEIISYLHTSHDFYMDVAIVDLEQLIRKMADTCDEKHSRIIMAFFVNYRDEIRKHFEYEENTAFPYILAIASGRKSENGYNIEQYERNHSNVDEKLNDLKNIVMKYMPSTCDDNLIQNVLISLYSLENDLEKHTYIEDDILVPMATLKEKEIASTKE